MPVNVRDYLDANAGGFLAALKQWLAIPSISSDPARVGDVERSARWLARHLRDTGFQQAEIWETPGLPAVFAEWPAADPRAPAVVVYGHHDVQPVTPLQQWETPPFTPAERGEQLIARGASDDKGQVLLHALGLRAHLAASSAAAPLVTIKLLIEGEEESGSPHLASLVRANRERLRCAAIVVSDTPMWARHVPTICIGTRGLVSAEISLYGPSTDLHSGAFGGGVPNPLHAMAALLAGLHDQRRRVTLPGFYDDVAPLADSERALFARLPFDEAGWLARAGSSRAADGEHGFTTLERIWARPTAEINGIWGGHTGPGRKTIIPRQAHAKVSLRLVPDQDPARITRALRDYVARNTQPGIRAEVDFDGPGVRPASVPAGSPAVQAAKRAMEKAFGSEVLFTRLGGSGPEADLADILGAPLVFIGVGLDEDQAHAPNENIEMPRLLKGAETAAYLWDELAAARTGWQHSLASPGDTAPRKLLTQQPVHRRA
jgi:acetylornithine deacetylase/succinyl-diaminopimelate desuccinylase-like protein